MKKFFVAGISVIFFALAGRADTFPGEYKGRLKRFGISTKKECRVTIDDGGENSYYITLTPSNDLSIHIDDENSEKINKSIREHSSLRIKHTNGGRLNEGIGYKKANITIENGVLKSISLYSEYLFFSRTSAVCGELTKVEY